MNIKLITENKKARFDYEIEETLEAGIELRGSEVKSLRAGTVNLKDSYVSFANGEAFLQNAHIGVYKASSYNNHIPERHRRLLLHREEIRQLEIAAQEKGLTCVPLKMYFKDGWVKVEIGVARGRKHGDKRELIKSRDVDREMKRSLGKRK